MTGLVTHAFYRLPDCIVECLILRQPTRVRLIVTDMYDPALGEDLRQAVPSIYRVLPNGDIQAAKHVRRPGMTDDQWAYAQLIEPPLWTVTDLTYMDLVPFKERQPERESNV